MEWWQVWLVMSTCLYIGARTGVGIWLGCFAAAALLSAGGALLNLGPLGQVQLFLGGSLAAILISERVRRLRDRF
ncbi:MAG: hypothetical protein GX195_07555 [Firmicutes bacterium]|nr:hypothetical protein [Bacillota bacterium]